MLQEDLEPGLNDRGVGILPVQEAHQCPPVQNRAVAGEILAALVFRLSFFGPAGSYTDIVVITVTF